MSSRKLLPALVGLAVGAALLAACGGGGTGSTPGGQLTDPRDVATATPWAEPPEVTFIEPGQLTPVGAVEGEGTPTGGATEECKGDTYTVKSGDVPSTIAVKCGVELQALLDANPGLEPTNLHAGEVLKIPR